MSKKNIVFDAEVRTKISQGISKLAAAVKVTLGPTGRVVMCERDFGDPYVTKDGVTVAKEIELSDPLENMGAQMVKQVTSQTSKAAGDGTTTATIYAEAIYDAGLKSIAAGAKSQEVKRGIDKAVGFVIQELAAMARPVISEDQMRQVAICSANQDHVIGTIVADAIGKVGKDGVVTIEEGRTLDTYVEVVDGLQFDRGMLSAHFATNRETVTTEYENPHILLVDGKVSNIKALIPILEKALKTDKKPFVVIAEDVDGEALATLVVNHARNALQAVAIKSPGFGDRRREMMEDLAIVTGGTLISQELGVSLEAAQIGHLGSCKKITVTQDTTTIVQGSGNPASVQERINHIKNRLDSVAGDFDKEKLQERLAKLTGGVARIVVGGATEAEVREKKDRIDDALHACKAAADEGILPGGGIAPLKARDILKNIKVKGDEAIGINIVRRALEAPLRQIAKNTGEDDGAILGVVVKSRKDNFGYNAATGEYGDMLKFGVIVPCKVERVALQNAASVAGLLLTTDCMISIIPDPKPLDGGPGFGM